ncbi:MAG TPA: endolytic transglycosylase MltG [Hyphomicrobiales bacterium]|nr:endolytic transglycosylase MltG [Hyphomicrobiales bacterium]
MTESQPDDPAKPESAPAATPPEPAPPPVPAVEPPAAAEPSADRAAPSPQPPSPPPAPAKRGFFRRRQAPPRQSAREARLARRNERWKKRARTPILVAADAVLTLAVLALAGGLAGIVYFNHALSAPGPLAAAKVIVVPRGAGTRDVGDTLEKAGAIKSGWMFFAAAQAAGDRGKLKAGEYQIPAHASLRAVVAMIAAGKVMQHPITIPEGLTSQQVVARLESEDVLKGDIASTPPEGSLLPETYNVVRDTPRSELLATMAEKDRELVKEVWAGRDPSVPLKSPEELVTLASLVEKETALPAERPRIAAVFVNRLKRGMRLQSDPTIIYGLVGGKGTLGRPISRADVAKATPYNTYTIRGLPPGPITNPGKASLEAAAHPAKTDDLYFVADGHGGHAFAATFAEHRKNVENLRAIEALRGEQVPDRMELDLDEDDDPAATAASPPARPSRSRRR